MQSLQLLKQSSPDSSSSPTKMSSHHRLAMRLTPVKHFEPPTIEVNTAKSYSSFVNKTSNDHFVYMNNFRVVVSNPISSKIKLRKEHINTRIHTMKQENSSLSPTKLNQAQLRTSLITDTRRTGESTNQNLTMRSTDIDFSKASNEAILKMKVEHAFIQGRESAPCHIQADSDQVYYSPIFTEGNNLSPNAGSPLPFLNERQRDLLMKRPVIRSVSGLIRKMHQTNESSSRTDLKTLASRSYERIVSKSRNTAATDKETPEPRPALAEASEIEIHDILSEGNILKTEGDLLGQVRVYQVNKDSSSHLSRTGPLFGKPNINLRRESIKSSSGNGGRRKKPILFRSQSTKPQREVFLKQGSGDVTQLSREEVKGLSVSPERAGAFVEQRSINISENRKRELRIDSSALFTHQHLDLETAGNSLQSSVLLINYLDTLARNLSKEAFVQTEATLKSSPHHISENRITESKRVEGSQGSHEKRETINLDELLRNFQSERGFVNRQIDQRSLMKSILIMSVLYNI